MQDQIQGFQAIVDRLFIDLSCKKSTNIYIDPSSPLLCGELGKIVFLLTYSQKYNYTEEVEEEIFQILEDAFNNINKIEDTSLNGLAGIGWILTYLIDNKLVSFSEVEKNIKKIYGFIESSLEKDFENCYFDLFYGFIGKLIFLDYFSDFYESDSLKKRINQSIEILDKFSLKISDEMITWGSKNERNETIYNLGLAHGIPSIISYLVHIKDNRLLSDKNRLLSESMIENACSWLIWISGKVKKTPEVKSVYPFISINNQFELREDQGLAWCYGDLGIAISLIRAGQSIDNKNILSYGLELAKVCSRVKISESKISQESGKVDMQFCHGLFGIVCLFQRINSLIKDKFIKDALNYWKELSLDYLDESNDFGGISYSYLDQDNKRVWSKSIGILNGISGVGLIILDLLSKNNSVASKNWTNLFLI